MHDYLERWNWEGTMLHIHHALYAELRERAGRQPGSTTAIAAGACQGQQFASALGAIAKSQLDIVKRCDQAKGFGVLPKRCIVEARRNIR